MSLVNKTAAETGVAENRDRIDADGYRRNVGLLVANGRGQLLWAKRFRRPGWQFPQGGIDAGESAEQAAYRELHEEVGLLPRHVEILGRTRGWLRYRLPQRYIRADRRPLCIGQKQRWFLMRLLGDDESRVRLDVGDKPEFDAWRWVDYWQPLAEIVYFKRAVYRDALGELSHLILPEGQRRLPDRYRPAQRPAAATGQRWQAGQ